MRIVVTLLSTVTLAALGSAVYFYLNICPTPSPNISGIFEGEAKLALATTTNSNYLDNEGRGYLGEPKIRIDWDEEFRYYIDLESDDWKPSYNSKTNTVTLNLPKLKGFRPTILSNTIEVTVDPAMGRKEWKVFAEEIKKIGAVSQSAMNKTLTKESSALPTIHRQVKQSLIKVVIKHFSLLGLQEPIVEVVLNDGKKL